MGGVLDRYERRACKGSMRSKTGVAVLLVLMTTSQIVYISTYITKLTHGYCDSADADRFLFLES